MAAPVPVMGMSPSRQVSGNTCMSTMTELHQEPEEEFIGHTTADLTTYEGNKESHQSPSSQEHFVREKKSWPNASTHRVMLTTLGTWLPCGRSCPRPPYVSIFSDSQNHGTRDRTLEVKAQTTQA
ncbi:uncharacterized protein LOC144824416 [Lissotriton helveticus]